MLPLLLLLPLLGVGIAFIAGILMEAFPHLITGLLGGLNLPGNIYSLLIEIPRPMWNDTVYGMPALANSTTGGIYSPSGYSGIIGPSMTNLYAGSRTAAFVLLAFVVVIAAFSFFLQNFRLVGEGTAMRILTGTVMVAVLIYIFPAIYDVIAAAVNSITYPRPGSIIPPEAIGTILDCAATVAPSSGADVGSILAGMIMNLFLFIFVIITYVSVAIMGVLRTFFIGAAFALMPVLLVLRLMPYVDKVADLFIQVIIGGILASVIVSFFFAFGYDVVTSAAISGLMKTLIAMGVLLACSLMMTVLIPHLGSLMSSVSTAITGAATGAVVGGAAVTTGAATAYAQAAPALQAAVAGGFMSQTGAALQGTRAVLMGGAGTFGAVAPRLVPGMGAAGYAIPTAVSMGKGAGGMDFVQRYAGNNPETADALLLQGLATPHDHESDPNYDFHKQAARVRTNFETVPASTLGQEYAMGNRIDIKDPEEYEEIGNVVKDRFHKTMEMSKGDQRKQDILACRFGRTWSTLKDHGADLRDPEKGRPLMDVARKEAEKELGVEAPKETVEKKTLEIFNKKAEKYGLSGISPITRAAALKNSKQNAKKIVEFMHEGKGVEN